MWSFVSFKYQKTNDLNTKQQRCDFILDTKQREPVLSFFTKAKGSKGSHHARVINNASNTGFWVSLIAQSLSLSQ